MFRWLRSSGVWVNDNVQSCVNSTAGIFLRDDATQFKQLMVHFTDDVVKASLIVAAIWIVIYEK